ncbi:unnamed protein product, partial [Ectocarpus sp. 6 AP-2014]
APRPLLSVPRHGRLAHRRRRQRGLGGGPPPPAFSSRPRGHLSAITSARPCHRRCWSLRRSHRHLRWRRCCCRRRGRECRSRRRRQRRASRGVRPRPRCWLPLAAGHPRASAASASFPSPLQDCSHCGSHHLRWIVRLSRRRRRRRPSRLFLPIQPRRSRRPSPSS